MKKIRYLLLVLAFSAASLNAQTSPYEAAQQANELYEAGDFEGARGLYEALIENGIDESLIYYNLGHTYLKLDNLGQALLNYRRAQNLTPRDEAIRTAVARVRASRVDIEGDETFPTDSLTTLTTSFMTLTEMNWLVLSLWVLFFVLCSIYIIYRRPVVRGLIVATGLALAFVFTLWISRLYSNAFRPSAVVLDSIAPIMSGPGEGYLQIYELHAAAEIRILSEQGEWGHFALPSGQEGWIQLGAIEEI